MRKMKKKIVLCCVISLLIIGGAAVVIYRNNTDYVFVDKSFQEIQLPSELNLTSKQWIDYTKDDPSLGTMWTYGFSLNKNENAMTLKYNIEAAFMRKGFVISEDSDRGSPGSYRASMTGSKIEVFVSFGYNPSSGAIDRATSVGMDVVRR